ncbi:MAG: hypothetical protein COZ70_05345 [Deltaproteobacteria bacterium CG_4_8_14_3_um_filter_51_11]|nr:MAG: hypothetical protein COZ70_05345 [Deltaproteobacteria bacterium CG_4_8_14_3_um_filter_51_11]
MLMAFWQIGFLMKFKISWFLTFLFFNLIIVSGYAVSVSAASVSQEVSDYWIKLFLTLAIFSLPILGLAIVLTQNVGRSALQGRAMLSPLVLFPFMFAIYFGVSAIELTDWEAKASVGQFFLIYAGFSAYLVGVFLTSTLLPTPGYVGMNTQSEFTFSINNLRLALLLTMVIGFIGFILIARSGLPLFSSDIQESRGGRSGYIMYMSFVFSDIVIMIMVARIVSKKSIFGSTAVDLCISLLSLFAMVVMGSRARVLYPILVPLFFYFLYKNKTLNLRFLFGSIAAAFFLIAFGGYRLSQTTDHQLYDAISFKFFSELNLASYTLELFLREFPERVDFLGIGALFWGIIAILPNEFTVLTTHLANIMPVTSVNTGLTPTLIGGFFVLDGIPTIIIGMFFFGTFLQWSFGRFIRNVSPGRCLFYAYLLVYALNCLKGGFLKDAEPIWHFVILSFLSTSSFRRAKK